MNEEIETFVNKIVELSDEFHENKTQRSATELELELAILRLLIGNNNFDELRHFVRLEKEVTSFLNKIEEKGGEGEEANNVS